MICHTETYDLTLPFTGDRIILTDVFAHYFSCMQDPRLFGKVTHLLFDVLFLIVYTTITGVTRRKHMETDFGGTSLISYHRFIYSRFNLCA